MESIDYSEKEYQIIETQEMDKELQFKLVKFNTGYYGIISHNPLTSNEQVILLSPEKDTGDKNISLFGGLGCKSFLVFARDAKKHMENAPLELVVMLGYDAPEEYREVITRDQAKTLYEKVEICNEIMQMKYENSFQVKYGDYFFIFGIAGYIAILIIILVGVI